jgi:anti-sigma regulatory factor (Ser/Thr protein kinase)
MKALKRAGYRIGIISDIGRISKDHVLSAYREIFSVADVFIASCDVGIMKDDPRIFDIALKASGSEAPKSVFIDDLKSNIGVAESVGMSTVQFVHGKTDLHSSLKSILEPVKKKRSGEAGMAGVAASKAGTRRLLEMLLKNAVAKVSDFSANDGITTGHAAMTQMIPVDFLTDLSRVDVAADPTDPLVRRLIERIENGNLSGNDGRPIRIDVKSDGRVSVFDGMHRIAALKALGVKYIPAMVVYFDRGLIGKIPSKDAPDIFGPYASGHESAGETKPSAEKKPEPTDIATETAASPGDPGGQARLANGGSGPDNIQVAALYEIPAHTSGHFDLFKREVELAVDNRKLGGMLDEKALDILYEMAGNIYRHSRNGYGYLSVESVRRGGDTGMRYTSVNEAPSFSMRDFFVGFSQVQAAWNDADSWHVGLPKMMEFADEFTLKYDSAANRLSISLIKWKTSPGEKSVAILMPMPDASTMRGVSQSIGEVPDYNMNRLDLLSLDKGPIGKIARDLRDGYSHRAAAEQETRNAENAKTGTGRAGSNTAGPASAPDGVDENAKPESPDTSTNVEISSAAMSNTERVQAVELTDAAKLIRNSENPSEIITVGLGTSWMAAYSRNKAEKYQDLNRLIVAIGRLLNHYKINCVAQQAGESDADFAKRIDVNGGRVVVLTGLNTIVRDDSPFAAFRDRRNVFLAGVDTEGAGLDEGCYLPIVEMLKLALYIGLKDMLRQDASSDNIATEPYRKFTNVFRFLPRAVRIPVYENLRQLYLVQEFA